MRRADPLRPTSSGPDRAAASPVGRSRALIAWLAVALVLALVAALALGAPRAAAQDEEQLAITVDPTVHGNPLDGEQLTATPGEWTPKDAQARYEWLRCDSAGLNCGPIAGATNPSSYILQPADVDHALRIRLTVAKDGRETSHDSGATAGIAPRAPANDDKQPPQVTGVAREGEVLHVAEGLWSGTPPLVFDYQWQRCNAGGGSCDAIAGAMSATYVLTAADVGSTLRVDVTASGRGGKSLPARSAPTGVVARAPLVSLEPPVITGVAEVERVLSATTGRWAGSGSIDYAYRWLRCRPDGSNCAPISGATSPRYTVRDPDAGFRLRVRVTAANDAGSSARESALTAVVPERPDAPQPLESAGGPAPPPLPRAGVALMQPFPSVRIKGFFTTSSIVLQLVRVTAPAGARIAVACRGRGCPYRRHIQRGRRRVRLRSLERAYGPGTRLEFRVTQPSRVGKYTRIVLRARKPPARLDRCLMPGNARPVRCPAPPA